MKVVAINGSPRKDGNCAQMLEVLGKVLEQEGIEFEVCQPGAKVHPCMACYHCLDNGTLRCVQDDDGVNEIIAKCIEAGMASCSRLRCTTAALRGRYEVRARPSDSGGRLRR